MPRYCITVEYDGAPFVGWQRQDNGPSVQGALEAALAALSGEDALVQGAGRTDAGVHALGQVAHFDLSRGWDPDRIRDGLNAHLGEAPVAVLAAQAVEDDFHARFSATRRHYLYRIANRRPKLALERGRAWRVPVPLDADAMHEAAQLLVGQHDFTTFRASECQAKSPVKTVDLICVSRRAENIEIEINARSFLHNQVRSIVGSLKLVGEGKWRADELSQALQARDRSACGPVAPAHGLYLVRVDYNGSSTNETDNAEA
jgi:tRNA pseudouridine38-40 synthase